MNLGDKFLMFVLDMLTIVGAIGAVAILIAAISAPLFIGQFASLATAVVVIPLSLSIVAHLAIARRAWPRR